MEKMSVSWKHIRWGLFLLLSMGLICIFLSDDLRRQRPTGVILRDGLVALCIFVGVIVYHSIGRGRRYYKLTTCLIGVFGYAALGAEMFLADHRTLASVLGVLSFSEIFGVASEIRKLRVENQGK